MGSPPELLIPQDLDLADGTIVVLSQARENANSSDPSEEKCRNELVLRVTVSALLGIQYTFVSTNTFSVPFKAFLILSDTC